MSKISLNPHVINHTFTSYQLSFKIRLPTEISTATMLSSIKYIKTSSYARTIYARTNVDQPTSLDQPYLPASSYFNTEDSYRNVWKKKEPTLSDGEMHDTFQKYVSDDLRKLSTLDLHTSEEKDCSSIVDSHKNLPHLLSQNFNHTEHFTGRVPNSLFCGLQDRKSTIEADALVHCLDPREVTYSDTFQHMDEQGSLLAESTSADKGGLLSTPTDIPTSRASKSYIFYLGPFLKFWQFYQVEKSMVMQIIRMSINCHELKSDFFHFRRFFYTRLTYHNSDKLKLKQRQARIRRRVILCSKTFYQDEFNPRSTAAVFFSAGQAFTSELLTNCQINSVFTGSRMLNQTTGPA